MMEKYTQPRAYFPACGHGSSLLAAISPGALFLVMGILIRLISEPAVVEREASSRNAFTKGMLLGGGALKYCVIALLETRNLLSLRDDYKFRCICTHAADLAAKIASQPIVYLNTQLFPRRRTETPRQLRCSQRSDS